MEAPPSTGFCRKVAEGCVSIRPIGQFSVKLSAKDYVRLLLRTHRDYLFPGTGDPGVTFPYVLGGALSAR